MTSEGLSRGSFVKVAASCDFYECPLTERSDPTLPAAGLVRFIAQPSCLTASAGFGAVPQGLWTLETVSFYKMPQM